MLNAADSFYLIDEIPTQIRKGFCKAKYAICVAASGQAKDEEEQEI